MYFKSEWGKKHIRCVCVQARDSARLKIVESNTTSHVPHFHWSVEKKNTTPSSRICRLWGRWWSVCSSFWSFVVVNAALRSSRAGRRGSFESSWLSVLFGGWIEMIVYRCVSPRLKICVHVRDETIMMPAVCGVSLSTPRVRYVSFALLYCIIIVACRALFLSAGKTLGNINLLTRFERVSSDKDVQTSRYSKTDLYTYLYLPQHV